METKIAYQEKMELEIQNLLSDKNRMRKDIREMERFFEKLSTPIIQKCIFRITRELRQLGEVAPGIKFLGDDLDHLDLFEQISLVALPGDLDLYVDAEILIRDFSQNEYDNMSEDNKCILNHQNIDNGAYCPVQQIQNDFIEYVTNYTNEKLTEYR